MTTTYSPHKYQGTGEYCDQCGGDELHHYWKDGEVVGNGVRGMELQHCKTCNQMTNHRGGECLKCPATKPQSTPRVSVCCGEEVKGRTFTERDEDGCTYKYRALICLQCGKQCDIKTV